jgi:glycosyltransferase involved in cell wall biosynthesis
MLLKTPKVSVVLAVYNGAAFVSEAVKSILNQTFSNFELIIINDGSLDNSEKVLDLFNDSRIIRIKNEKNLGLINSLNAGIKIARGEYIARMDADDISVPNRFEKQVEFLENNKNIGVLGTAVYCIDKKGLIISKLTQPLLHEAIVWKMCFECALIHPSVMMRKSVLLEDGPYDLEFKHIEDTELWMRLLERVEFANLPDVLHKYRLHGSSIGNLQSNIQYELSLVLRKNFLNNFFKLNISTNLNSWFSSKDVVLSEVEKKEGINLLFGIYEGILQKFFPSKNSLDFIRVDFIKMFLKINTSKKRVLYGLIFNFLRKILPSDFRHKLKIKIGIF